jgi:aspartate aminotransferase
MAGPVSDQMRRVKDALGPFAAWALTSTIMADLKRPGISDFCFGNPHDVAMPEYVSALMRGVQPSGPDHYAYKMNEPDAVTAIAAGLATRFNLPFEPEDVFMTNGNFAGLAIALKVLTDPGDEVIFVSPPWFFYETLIVAAGATPVRVYADRATFDLDLDAIAAAITPQTRAIIVNSPNNPSGRIYPTATLDALAVTLSDASARSGRDIYLLSDEAYNRIVFDDRVFPTPTAHYPHSLLLYTYAKTLLAPGSRLGYVALPPSMPGREELREALLIAQITFGWAFPVAPLQYAVPELEGMTVDIKTLQRRRDALCSALQEQGYECLVPEGTFYITVRSPLEDDLAFCDILNAHDVYVLPGNTFEMPGWFRISVTANDEMVDRGIPGFAAAIQEARR